MVITEIKDKPWVERWKLVVWTGAEALHDLDHRLFHGYYVSLLRKRSNPCWNTRKRCWERKDDPQEDKGKILPIWREQTPLSTFAVHAVSAGTLHR
jgi:hypothetical protein